MNLRGLITGVRIEAGQIYSNTDRKLEDQEAIYYLNKAQQRFVDSKVRKRDGLQYQFDVIDAEAIDTLIVQQDITDANLILENGKYKFDLDSDLLYYVDGSIITDCGEHLINLVRSSYAKTANSLPYYKSTKKFWNTTLVKNALVINPHQNPLTIKGGSIQYVRKFNQIELPSTASELREQYHLTLIDIAVSLIKLAINDPSFRAKDSDNKINSITIN